MTNRPEVATAHGVVARHPTFGGVPGILYLPRGRTPDGKSISWLDEAGVPNHAYEVPGVFRVFPILVPWAASSWRVHRDVGTFVRDRIRDAHNRQSQ